jgi:hypothetical protein
VPCEAVSTFFCDLIYLVNENLEAGCAQATAAQEASSPGPLRPDCKPAEITHDAHLRKVHLKVACLQQLEYDGLHILTHIASLCGREADSG